jgi:hypothetical protein
MLDNVISPMRLAGTSEIILKKLGIVSTFNLEKGQHTLIEIEYVPP